MKKIILASKSKARRNVLKQLGLKFTTDYADIKESRKLVKGCKDLVIKNAKNKALKIAEKHKTGIIISADTVCLIDKTIIGKPANLKCAKSTLKKLSMKPQWIYTGVCVLDAGNKTMFTDYEKTRVLLRKMTDKEIDNYFKKVSPFDKAGSFDIQGLGACFVKKIEGCFYNVVGLPVYKLVLLLAKAGVNIP